jgi:hypothetical protein
LNIKSIKLIKVVYLLSINAKSICLVRFGFMVFNTTFNNISVISWQSVLLTEETGVPWENHRSVTSHWHTLSHNVISSTEEGAQLGFNWFPILSLKVIHDTCTTPTDGKLLLLCTTTKTHKTRKWDQALQNKIPTYFHTTVHN